MVAATEVNNFPNTPCEFTINNPKLNLPDDLSKLKATLKRPGSRREEPVTLKLLSDNTLSLSFLPKTPGDYILSIMMRRRPIPGSPFTITVTDGTPSNIIGTPLSFALEDIPLRDIPRVRVTLQRPGADTEEPIQLKQNSDGSLSVTFIPREPGVHKVHVRKDEKPLPGSPYEVEVIGDRVVDTPSKKPSQNIPREEAVFTKEIAPCEEKLPVGRTCDLNLDIPEFSLPRDFRKLSATLRRPSSKREERINLELNPNNTLGKIFTSVVSMQCNDIKSPSPILC